jgi:hypothetical protein
VSKFETDTVEAPAYWACYLINGDASGMEDDEIAECDRWCESLGEWSIVGCPSEESEHFGRFYFPVARRWLGCDLVTYELLKEIK